MFLTITSIITALVVINFLLLFISCNKTTKKTVVNRAEKAPMYRATRKLNSIEQIELAPTGS